jgi:hypothetical protein
MVSIVMAFRNLARLSPPFSTFFGAVLAAWHFPLARPGGLVTIK